MAGRGASRRSAVSALTRNLQSLSAATSATQSWCGRGGRSQCDSSCQSVWQLRCMMSVRVRTPSVKKSTSYCTSRELISEAQMSHARPSPNPANVFWPGAHGRRLARMHWRTLTLRLCSSMVPRSSNDHGTVRFFGPSAWGPYRRALCHDYATRAQSDANAYAATRCLKSDRRSSSLSLALPEPGARACKRHPRTPQRPRSRKPSARVMRADEHCVKRSRFVCA